MLELSAINMLIFLSLFLFFFVIFIACEIYLHCVAKPMDYFSEAKKLNEEDVKRNHGTKSGRVGISEQQIGPHKTFEIRV
ncbi:uncharacterized protein CELE_R160.14 [Caenorhabditis elegans]|uniref:Uncharacterized protein n=1 Tax=Caenorhabditis elegans TaxID=6239 RepID=A0A5E4LWB2_CAEEL|nr:Uncharacterized protein CELE_R160.14 [Caenorhabditis elegans]VVC12341.1 Uncharacterized protein CELE_R160.14 [Caenorhabditis elegans]